MKDTNKMTIEAYEAGIDQYIQNTPNKRGAVVEDWIDKSIAGLPLDAKILEVGSAYGRDAKIIEEKGYRVEKTDATQGFVSILQQDDPTAHHLNILTDPIETGYNLIIANAVLLHFTVEETKSVAHKILQALTENGTFAFTVKVGKGEAWQDNKGMGRRYFKYWSKEDIVSLLSDVGYTNINAWVDSSDGTGVSWIMIIAKKV
jgi:2-polyprenyl-3-methyl-5-hydroxy-6-metoxy-1,4-benzoquinol methylase